MANFGPYDRPDEEDEVVVRDTISFMLKLVETAAPRSHKRTYDTISLDDDEEDDPITADDHIFSRKFENSSKRQKTSHDNQQTGPEQSGTSVAVDDQQPLTAEPRVPLTRSLLRRKTCQICDSTRLSYLIIRNGQYEQICSDTCLEKYKKFRNQPNCLSCRSEVIPGQPAYRPNFGVIGNAVCSQSCLLKYDEQFGPKAKCRNGRCAKPISLKKSKTSFHWQSMDFCSADCVNELLRAVGAKCTQCRAAVPVSAIGKYSVRFGDVVRQFCNTACLSAHKKSHKSCSFCQTEIRSSSQAYTSATRPVEREFGEGPKSFCNNTCLDDFLRQDADKKINRETETTIEMMGGNFCDICLCYFPSSSPSPDHMTFRNTNSDVIFLCGTICASAYRFKHKINSLFCNYCYKLDWNLTTGVLLRFSEKQKIFCSRRCMNLFIIRVRQLINCSCCQCCKYQFDLIEQCDASGETTYYCSLTCLNLVRESNSMRSKYGSKLDFVKCITCLKIKKGLFHVVDKHDPDNVHSLCSYSCYSLYLKNPPKPKLRPPPKPLAAIQNTAVVPVTATNGLTSSSLALTTASAVLRNMASSGITQTARLAAATPVSVSHPIPNILKRPSVSSSSSSLLQSNSNVIATNNHKTYSHHTKAVNGTSDPPQDGSSMTTASSEPYSTTGYSKSTILIRTDSPLGQLVSLIREQGLEQSSDLRNIWKKATSGQSSSANVKEILVVKEKAKSMANAAVQVRRGMVTKAVSCKPFLVDASVSTEDADP